MPPLMTIEVDTAALFAAMDTLPSQIAAALKVEAKITADNIDREATARIARATGKTAEGIVVEETHNGDGYVVLIRNNRAHIGHFLEFGTKYMAQKPFFFISARLEEGAHDRRALEAVKRVIAEKGLGD